MKGYEKIKELIYGELSDYGHFEIGEIELEDQDNHQEYYSVDIKKGYGNDEKTLRFKYDRDEDEIYVDLSEDSWEMVRSFDWQVKYFWMAVLNW